MSKGIFVISLPNGCKFWKPQQFAGMTMHMTELAAIILAAGKGTRMKSDSAQGPASHRQPANVDAPDGVG
jgi:hypothetical protein